MTRDEIKTIIDDIKIQEGWMLSLREDNVYTDMLGRGRLFLQIQFEDTCNVTGKPYTSYCRKWYLSEHMTKQEIVRTAYKAYEAAVLHEMQEKFLYKGRQIYGPHTCVDALWDIATEVDIRESHKV